MRRPQLALNISREDMNHENGQAQKKFKRHKTNKKKDEQTDMGVFNAS